MRNHNIGVHHNCTTIRLVKPLPKMWNHVDLYLGVFLISCGFGISLLNLKNIVSSGSDTSYILLSENVLLMCIGIAFLCRAIYFVNPENLTMENVELKMAGYKSNDANFKCDFLSLLLSYGPLVVSLVNSFLSLVIDNYMHYRLLRDIKKKEQENVVQEIGETSRSIKELKISEIYKFWRKHFPAFTIALQWIVPIIFSLFMYPMNVREMSMYEVRHLDDSCMATLHLGSSNCNVFTDIDNTTIELRKNLITPASYLQVVEKEHQNENSSTEIDLVLQNVFKILKNYNNHTDFQYTNLTKSLREPKYYNSCAKMCFTDNKNMLVYMFLLAVVSYFIPITISVIILTKIHIMDVKKASSKVYITREFLYNILFWTPVMFDTLLSSVMCTFTMHSTRTALLNVAANIYQVVRNFMQTKYYNENSIAPV